MKVTCKGTVFYQEQYLDQDFKFWPVPPEAAYAHLGVKVCPLEVEFEVPDNFDPRPGQIEILERELKNFSADFERRKNELLKQIADLRALEFTSSSNDALGL